MFTVLCDRSHGPPGRAAGAAYRAPLWFPIFVPAGPHSQGGKPMNASTARALFVGLLVAVWVWVSEVARVRLSPWAPLVALGCYFAAGGGLSGLQKALFGTISGVAWVLVTEAVLLAIGGTRIVAALVWGAMACAIMFQSRVPFLSFTAGAFAGACVALG